MTPRRAAAILAAYALGVFIEIGLVLEWVFWLADDQEARAWAAYACAVGLFLYDRHVLPDIPEIPPTADSSS